MILEILLNTDNVHTAGVEKLTEDFLSFGNNLAVLVKLGGDRKSRNISRHNGKLVFRYIHIFVLGKCDRADGNQQNKRKQSREHYFKRFFHYISTLLYCDFA